MYSFRDQVLDPYNSKLRHSHSVSDHFTLPPTPTHRLCLNESTAELSTTLAGAEADLLDSGTLGDGLLTLGKDELDVAGVGHVGVDLIELLVLRGFVTEGCLGFRLQHTRP